MCWITYIAWQEFDGHTQNEYGPEDVQTLQHKQQPIKEVISKERRINGHRIHPSTMQNP